MNIFLKGGIGDERVKIDEHRTKFIRTWDRNISLMYSNQRICYQKESHNGKLYRNV